MITVGLCKSFHTLCENFRVLSKAIMVSRSCNCRDAHVIERIGFPLLCHLLFLLSFYLFHISIYQNA